MATAAYGLQGTGNNATKSHKEHLKKSKDSRRRQAALLFLNNISLDGRPLYNLSNGNGDQKDAGEHRRRDIVAEVGHPSASSQGSVPQVSPALIGSVLTAVPGIGVSPVRPTLVMCPGPGASAVGANEVFLDGSNSVDTIPTDTPLSPIAQSYSSARSPSVLSPLPTDNVMPVDSRQR